MLVASELVTNAMLHSGCDSQHWIETGLSRRDRRVRLTVCDPGLTAGSATLGFGDVESPGGLGLVIVEALTYRWGTERGETYTVWAEF